MNRSDDNCEILVDERLVEAIQGDPDKTICLVVTLDWAPTEAFAECVRESTKGALQETKWRDIPVIVTHPGCKIEAVNMPIEDKGTTSA